VDIFEIFSDGASRGNPGKASAGFVIYKNKTEIFAGKKFLGIATNNFAEFSALILAMEKCQELKINKANFFLDSQLIVRQVLGEYKIRNVDLKKLFLRFQKILPDFEKISFKHVAREKNCRADQLANQALNEN